MAQQNANFATIFSVWDRIFGTYRQEQVHGGLFGLTEIPNGSELNPIQLLVLPFVSAKPPAVATEDLQLTASERS